MYTVPRLKQMAKYRGHRRYSSLRGDELLNLLNPPHLLDQDVPNINVPILAPVQAATPPSNSFKTKVKTLKSTAKSIYDDVKKKTREFADWILDYVPESIKKPINKRVEALKQQVSDILEDGILNSTFVNRSLR